MQHLSYKTMVVKMIMVRVINHGDSGNQDSFHSNHPNAKVTHMKEFVNVVVLSDHGQSNQVMMMR